MISLIKIETTIAVLFNKNLIKNENLGLIEC